MFEESALLECRCTADPVPSFAWTLDGKPIAVGTKYKQGISTDGNTHTIFLEVSQLTKKDSGLYKVTAKNNKGDGSANIELNIGGIEFKFVDKINLSIFLAIIMIDYLDYPKVLHHLFLVNQLSNKLTKQRLFKSI